MIESSARVRFDILALDYAEPLTESLKIGEHDGLLLGPNPPNPAVAAAEAVTVLRSQRRFSYAAQPGDRSDRGVGPNSERLLQRLKSFKPPSKIRICPISGAEYFGQGYARTPVVALLRLLRRLKPCDDVHRGGLRR